MDTRPSPRRATRPIRPSALAAALCAWALVAMVHSPALAAGQQPNGADRMIIWSGCPQLATLTDDELDLWRSRGVDGFACMGKQLWGMGGAHNFTGDPNADLKSSQYSLQRSLRDSRIVERAAARGMKMYLGAKLVNYYNTATPLRDWFDDEGWSKAVLPNIENLAGAARQLGFAGLAFDQELYPQHGGARSATWNWDYPGNSRSEQQVRAKARQRGRELMTRILGAFADVELLVYDVELPESWEELVQQEVNGHQAAHSKRLDIDFWDGLSSVDGYRAIRLIEAVFYKGPQLGTWDNAFHYHYNRLYSLLSRRLSNWSYASSRLHVSPFSWIDPGPRDSGFDDARPASYVSQQLEAFRKWGMGGEFADYSYGGLRSFDYSPYASVMSAASTPAVVDSHPPTLALTGSTASTAAATTALQGTANDNLAIRAVRATSNHGHSGTARLTWQIRSGGPRGGYAGEMLWSIPNFPLEDGENRITLTAEDIKGLTTSSTFSVHSGSPSEGGPEAPPSEAVPPAPGKAQEPPTTRTKRGARRSKQAKRRAARRRCLRRARSRRSPAGRRVAVRRCVKRFRTARP